MSLRYEGGSPIFTDPTKRPAGMVEIRCTDHGRFVVWCSPPAPTCHVACPRACADDRTRRLPIRDGAAIADAKLTRAQEDGRACFWCGREDQPMVPFGQGRRGQVFACAEDCRFEVSG